MFLYTLYIFLICPKYLFFTGHPGSNCWRKHASKLWRGKRRFFSQFFLFAAAFLLSVIKLLVSHLHPFFAGCPGYYGGGTFSWDDMFIRQIFIRKVAILNWSKDIGLQNRNCINNLTLSYSCRFIQFWCYSSVQHWQLLFSSHSSK